MKFYLSLSRLKNDPLSRIQEITRYLAFKICLQNFIIKGCTYCNLERMSCVSKHLQLLIGTQPQRTTILTTVIIILQQDHIQFTTHYFDFEPKKLHGNRCRSNDPPKINE